MICVADKDAEAISDGVDVLIERFVDSSLTDEIHGEAFEAISELISSGCNDGTTILLSTYSSVNTFFFDL